MGPVAWVSDHGLHIYITKFKINLIKFGLSQYIY